MEPPTVFASYSHDSDEHKQWVLKLSTQLIENGVNVILDQWELGAGDDITLFMEKGVKGSDRVLVICTDAYVRKANAGEGGVGYERLIVTAQLAQDLGTKKFIPIIRQSSNEERTPTFLATRKYIDFEDDDEFDEKFDELLHEIHDVLIIPKPRLGRNPLSNLPSKPEASSHNLPDIPEKVESVTHAYESAFDLVRANDALGWARLVRRVRPNAFKSLVIWRQKELDKQQPESIEQRYQAVDKAVDIVAPLISMALVGVESCNQHFNDQEYLLDDLLNIRNRDGWDPSGYTSWIDIPDALGYVYHSLHGSLCIMTDQIVLALGLARVKTRRIIDSRFVGSVWEHSELMGWSKSLGGKCTDNWKFLVNAYKRWKWLDLIFEDEVTYQTSLTAYYLALHIHELAVEINSGREVSPRGHHFSVPIDFLTEKNEVKQRAISLLLRNPALPELWTCLNVTQDQMKDSWDDWIHSCGRWLMGVYKNHWYGFDPMPHENFFDNL
ncbi:MAG: toll/interleukin-1 receptor domain-containing protein [Candidatus Poribacteria bacterium]|nr:toll/interleukin-1 receptor domain-containing protein [Candidatus Poribacteria bacterium]MDE0469256.1 toll/interleukin-1 receptor domain-containing protein [Candidatus Poribacteria bacterium]